MRLFACLFSSGEGRSVETGGGETVSNWLNAKVTVDCDSLQRLTLHEEEWRLRTSLLKRLRVLCRRFLRLM